MNSHERVLKSLNHEEPDRIPIDLGATIATGIHATAYRRLRRYVVLPAVEPRVEGGHPTSRSGSTVVVPSALSSAT